MSQPDYPTHLKPVDEVVDIPLYKLETVWEDIHPQEIKLGTYPVVKAGKVTMKSGYVSAGTYLVVASSKGTTVKETNEKCLGVLKTIEFPGSPQYRIDIGGRLKEQLPLLQKLGFVTGLEYE